MRERNRAGIPARCCSQRLARPRQRARTTRELPLDRSGVWLAFSVLVHTESRPNTPPPMATLNQQICTQTRAYLTALLAIHTRR